MKHLLQFCLCAGLAAPVMAASQADRDAVDDLVRLGLLLPSQSVTMDLSERTTCYSGTISAGTTVDITFVLTQDCCNWEINSCLSDETDTRFLSLVGPGINLSGWDDPGVCPRDCASFNPDVLSPSLGTDNNTGGLPPVCLPLGTYVLTVYSYSSYNPSDCSYVDPGPFTVCINDCGHGTVDTDDLPTAFTLAQNVPNPFNPTTTINFSMAEAGTASLKVFDIAGHEVATLVNGMTERGEHSVVLDASQLNSGMYFYTLQANGQTASRKMVLVK